MSRAQKKPPPPGYTGGKLFKYTPLLRRYQKLQIILLRKPLSCPYPRESLCFVAEFFHILYTVETPENELTTLFGLQILEDSRILQHLDIHIIVGTIRINRMDYMDDIEHILGHIDTELFFELTYHRTFHTLPSLDMSRGQLVEAISKACILASLEENISLFVFNNRKNGGVKVRSAHACAQELKNKTNILPDLSTLLLL